MMITTRISLVLALLAASSLIGCSSDGSSGDLSAGGAGGTENAGGDGSGGSLLGGGGKGGSSGKGGSAGKNAATLGGQVLAVSKYSKNADVAADLVLYMTSAPVQKERAIKGSFNPTVAALYKDPDILKASPFMGELLGVFSNAVGRPATVTGAKYNQVSNQFWNAAHEVLSGKAKADDALGRLDANLNRLARSGRWD